MVSFSFALYWIPVAVGVSWAAGTAIVVVANAAEVPIDPAIAMTTTKPATRRQGVRESSIYQSPYCIGTDRAVPTVHSAHVWVTVPWSTRLDAANPTWSTHRVKLQQSALLGAKGIRS